MAPPRPSLAEHFRSIRAVTRDLAAPLSPEDMCVQVCEVASPTKWHLAHTSWFFDTFVLQAYAPDWQPPEAAWAELFNSYYHTVGKQFARPQRGWLTRPGLAEVLAYRDRVDAAMDALLDALNSLPDAERGEALARIALGLNHEEQHQELLLTDAKLLLSVNPLQPSYRVTPREHPATPETPLDWVGFAADLVEIGVDPPRAMDAADPVRAFAYDNEGPRHRRFVEAFQLATRPVTNAEFAAFVDDGGYREPTLWLDPGWVAVQAEAWQAPLGWLRDGGAWTEFTLDGRRPLDPHAPVCHLSFFEADAYARWAGARLPTEAEWELAARAHGEPRRGNFVDAGRLHPGGAAERGADAGAPPAGTAITRLYGDVWEWTRSAYEPYPGYAPVRGALGEYNGKFMSQTMVLRGGSCATPRGHVRPSYRNFFEPQFRWQFSGLRLARD